MKTLQPASHRLACRAPRALPAGLLLWFCLGLQAVPQEPSHAPAAKVSTESPSALRRWWEGLSRQKQVVQEDDQSILITETGWSVPERVYKRTVDAEGRFKESYREYGQLKPVDEGVRRWVDTTLRGSRRQPPVPPLPPTPPLPSSPPTPPTPPEPSRESLLEPAMAAFETLQTDARLIALLGTPITREAQVKGSIRTWGPGEPHGFQLFSPTGGAKADVQLIIHGPKGSARLYLQGERKGKVWSFFRLEAQSSQGGAPLNLLAK